MSYHFFPTLYLCCPRYEIGGREQTAQMLPPPPAGAPRGRAGRWIPNDRLVQVHISNSLIRVLPWVSSAVTPRRTGGGEIPEKTAEEKRSSPAFSLFPLVLFLIPLFSSKPGALRTFSSQDVGCPSSPRKNEVWICCGQGLEMVPVVPAD